MEAHKFHLLSHIRFSSSRENFVVNLLLEIATEKKELTLVTFIALSVSVYATSDTIFSGK